MLRSVASVFLSRWDSTTRDKVPDALRDKLGIAVGQQVYKAYRDTLESDRWQRLANFGARPATFAVCQHRYQRPQGLRCSLYPGAPAAPNTIDTMPEKTLLAFGEHSSSLGGASAQWGRLRVCSGQIFERQESISTNLLRTCNRKEPSLSTNRGKTLLDAIESKGKELQHAS